MPFERTHNLSALLDALLPSDPMLDVLRTAFLQLNVYAVAFRYPGESATRHDAQNARALCASVRSSLRQHLGLTPA